MGKVQAAPVLGEVEGSTRRFLRGGIERDEGGRWRRYGASTSDVGRRTGAWIRIK